MMQNGYVTCVMQSTFTYYLFLDGKFNYSQHGKLHFSFNYATVATSGICMSDAINRYVANDMQQRGEATWVHD